MKLIDNVRHAWRMWSVRVLAFGSALFAFLIAAPDQALAIWQGLPPEAQAFVPNAKGLGLILMVLATIARVLRQAPAPAPAIATPAPLGLIGAARPASSLASALTAPIAREIRQLVVHCSATPAGKAFFAADIRRWHKEKGWADIGYHFVVDLDGVIEVGRPLAKAGAHVEGHNATSIGICYVGGVDAKYQAADTRTPAQKAALVELLRALKRRWPGAQILGHRDFAGVAKACPSFDAKGEYADLRP